VKLVFGDWIASSAANVPNPKIEWMVYSKRPLLDHARCSFVIPYSGEDARDGDETDDVMCVAAACARVRTRTGKVCLVSGDEMRWTSLCERVRHDWESVERGPRESPSQGNRLVSHILNALRRCGGKRANFLECAAQPPAQYSPTSSNIDTPPSFDAWTQHIPVATSMSGVFGDAAGAAVILAASLLALTLAQGM
jgi:hypothetical protein